MPYIRIVSGKPHLTPLGIGIIAAPAHQRIRPSASPVTLGRKPTGAAKLDPHPAALLRCRDIGGCGAGGCSADRAFDLRCNELLQLMNRRSDRAPCATGKAGSHECRPIERSRKHSRHSPNVAAASRSTPPETSAGPAQST